MSDEQFSVELVAEICHEPAQSIRALLEGGAFPRARAPRGNTAVGWLIPLDDVRRAGLRVDERIVDYIMQSDAVMPGDAAR